MQVKHETIMCRQHTRSNNSSRTASHCKVWLSMALATATLGVEQTCQAGPRDDAFYHQLLKLPESNGYSPTRTFTVISDEEHGNQLVAEDDPNLRFNLLWMQQYQPGYKSRRGGSAIGTIFRSYVKSAYKAYRERNAGALSALSALPDENGSVKGSGYSGGEMDYNLKLTDDEVRLKVQYSF